MSNRIADIEMLRGFAVLFVVIHHANGTLFTWSSSAMSYFYSHFCGGVGVDLFFAISGFVIAKDLIPRLRESKDGRAARAITLAFWVRRAWRLWPSAWLWLGVILLASVWFNSTGAFGSFHTNLEATVAGVLQIANLRFADSFMRYFYGASFPYWSLSLEEQFYLLLPLVVLIARRYLVWVLLALVLVQFFQQRSLLMMMFRTDAIALGVLLALWSAHPSYRAFKPARLARYGLGVVVLISVLLFMAALGSEWAAGSTAFTYGVIAVVSAVLVWIASYDADLLFPKGMFKSMMVWLGARSYAIYLIHIPAFFFVREFYHRLSASPRGPDESLFWPFLIVAGALILLLSDLNYRFVEVPLRARGVAMANKMIKKKAL